MKAIILAGGLGTRLRPLVHDLPKPMASVAGRPFLEYVLDGLVAGGVDEMILAVGYRAELIQAHFGSAYKGRKIRHSIESDPLGTGGAIARALRGEGEQPVLVLNGDTLSMIDYRDFISWYRQAPTLMAMVLQSVADVSRFGAVMTQEGRACGFEEKGRSGPGLINAGIYIMTPDIFRRFDMPERFSLEVDFLGRHCSDLLPRTYVTDSYFIDIGVPESFDRAQWELPARIHE